MKRALVLGAGVLDGMKLRAFKGILAHEYGHFHNEDTAGGGFALAVRRSVLTMAVGLGPVATQAVGSAGDFYWGGAASTIFWVDPAEDLVVIFMTQLLPSSPRRGASWRSPT